MLAPVPRGRRVRRHDAWQVRRDARRRFRRHPPQPRLRAERAHRRNTCPPTADLCDVSLRAAVGRGLWQLGRAPGLRIAAGGDRMSTLTSAEISAGATPEAVLQWAYETFPRVVIVASFQAESSVLIDMASRIPPDARVLTLAPGRLPQPR